ncbi:MAG TPA: hypothetical protein VGN83_23680 [Falsiroseomonas sp.]|jgi:hypothetical protein|nr:hypothetical protein [Falsiroseomonas sp.]
MSDIDRVFARFRDEKAPTIERREVRSIPQRGTGGSRTVEVVHVRSGAAARHTARPHQSSFGVRAAAWDDGFPARQVVTAAALVEPVSVETTKPIAHVMLARTYLLAKAEAAPSRPDQEASTPVRRGRGRPRKQAVASPTRRIADPFDPSDDGANCMRCGYAIQPARERRGLMTCAGCG